MPKKRGWYHNVSKERREEICKKISAGVKKQHQNMSSKKKLKMRIKQSKKKTEHFKKISSKDYKKFIEHRTKKIKEYYDSNTISARENKEYQSYLMTQVHKRLTIFKRRKHTKNGRDVIQEKWNNGEMAKAAAKTKATKRRNRDRLTIILERKNNYWGVVYG